MRILRAKGSIKVLISDVLISQKYWINQMSDALKLTNAVALTIDLGSKKDTITFKPTDCPLVLSEDFCKRNNLDSSVQLSVYDYLSQTFFPSSSPKRLSKTPDVKHHTKDEITQLLNSTTPQWSSTAKSCQKSTKSSKVWHLRLQLT